MNTENVLLKTGHTGHVREGCRMVEPCSALARTGRTQHRTSLPFNPAMNPVLSLSLSGVFKYICSDILCFCVLGILAQCGSAQLMVTQIVYWTGTGLMIGAIELG